MKDKTKAKLLKARGILKKVVSWAPAYMIPAGMIAFTGMLAGGLVMNQDGYEDFKNTPIYSQAYSQEYEEAQELYANGEMNVYDFNKKMEHLESMDFTKEVMNQAGEAADPYKAKINTGLGVAIGALAPAALAVGSTVLIGSSLGESGEEDIEMAKQILAADEPPKKKDPEEEEREDEEVLPNIEDSCYSE